MIAKKNISTVVILSIIIIYNAIFYLLFLNLGGSVTVSWRGDRAVLVFLVIGFFIYTLKNIRLNINNSALISTFMFLGLYTACALLSVNYIDTVMSYLPTIAYVFLGFFFFFYLSFSGKITSRQINFFYVSFFVISLLAFLEFYLYKASTLSSVYMHSNNMGYLFVLLLPALALMLRDKRILMTILSFLFLLLVFNSAKRGAIVIGSLAVAYIVFSNLKYLPKKYKLFIFFVAGLSLIGVYYYVLTKPDMFMRFGQGGGSGRDVIYTNLLNGWADGNFVSIIFGNGFFSSTKVNVYNGIELMAHSDWLEVLYDMGLVGVFAYLYMAISFIRQRAIVRHYRPNMLLAYDLCLIIWGVKSVASGVLMDKASLLLFSCMGLILGFTLKGKYAVDKSVTY